MPVTPTGGRVSSSVGRGSLLPRRLSSGALTLACLLAFGCGDSTGPVADDCDTIQDITVGVPVEGVLGTGDCRIAQDNSFADYWRLVLTSRTTLQIDLTSTAFDAYMFINTPTGVNLTQSDDGGEDENVRIIVTLDPGTYHILANSFTASGFGPYELTVAISPP